ncbi:MAG: hypothetical protein ACKVH8_10835 [Pirellulales bacterium]
MKRIVLLFAVAGLVFGSCSVCFENVCEAQNYRRSSSSRYYQNVNRYQNYSYTRPYVYSPNPYNGDQYYRLKGYMDSYPYRPFSSSYNPTFNNRGNSRYFSR